MRKAKKKQKRHWVCAFAGCGAEGYGGTAMLRDHIDRVHKKITFKCDQCKVTVCNKGALTRQATSSCTTLRLSAAHGPRGCSPAPSSSTSLARPVRMGRCGGPAILFDSLDCVLMRPARSTTPSNAEPYAGG